MTTAEFLEDIDNEKTKAYNNAYFMLASAMQTQTAPDRILVDIAKYIIDRKDGKPAMKQELTGKDGTPLIIGWKQ